MRDLPGPPVPSRPHMPGYGTLPPDEGTGLLPWSWAEERLARSHDYWVATVREDGRPHLMPVWGVFAGGCLWFSSARSSTKARNLAANGTASVSTDNAYEPVVVQGPVEVVDDLAAITAFAELVDDKYGTSYGVEFFSDGRNACFGLRPTWAFGLTEDDFAGSPTRWTFPAPG